MRKVFLFLTIILLGAAFCKKRMHETMTVIKDCSGTYLRLDNKDYHVCNPEALVNFPNGTTVKASFEKLKSCTSLDNEIICELYHINEGWVKVKKIE
jgi:hypothetical protein